MYTAFSPGTKNLFLVLSAACCIVAFFLMDAMRKEQKRRKWVCGILLCILGTARVWREEGSETEGHLLLQHPDLKRGHVLRR